MEKEAEIEVRKVMQAQREKKMKLAQKAQPPKPKEISVIAGDGKRVTITLGQDKDEGADSRQQIAMAAGLKHIKLPEAEYDPDAPFSGSLRRVKRGDIQNGRPEINDGTPAWSDSLRHVGDVTSKKQQKKKNNDDLHGDAPWMGTLRHVVADEATKTFKVNQHQSMRYPDEDAGNPYENMQGCNARPHFPLTPAAVINGTSLSRDSMARSQEDAEVSRIRNNIRQSQTVSTALLNVLMPKLLKEHESRHREPLERDEAEKIMEEILAMQIGLNTEQQCC